MNIAPIADVCLNDSVIEKLLRIVKQKKLTHVKILDLGAGQGYNSHTLASYMKKHGISFDITAVELDENVFKAYDPHIKFISYNLNDDFQFGKFDFIIATEIIEHLQDPYHFINNICNNLDVGGSIYVTSPNVCHYFSLLRILMKGRPNLFDMDNPAGHIMPIFPFMIQEALRQYNNEHEKQFLVSCFYNRGMFVFFDKKLRLKQYTLPIKNRFFGNITIYHIQENP